MSPPAGAKRHLFHGSLHTKDKVTRTEGGHPHTVTLAVHRQGSNNKQSRHQVGGGWWVPLLGGYETTGLENVSSKRCRGAPVGG